MATKSYMIGNQGPFEYEDDDPETLGAFQTDGEVYIQGYKAITEYLSSGMTSSEDSKVTSSATAASVADSKAVSSVSRADSRTSSSVLEISQAESKTISASSELTSKANSNHLAMSISTSTGASTDNSTVVSTDTSSMTRAMSVSASADLSSSSVISENDSEVGSATLSTSTITSENKSEATSASTSATVAISSTESIANSAETSLGLAQSVASSEHVSAVASTVITISNSDSVLDSSAQSVQDIFEADISSINNQWTVKLSGNSRVAGIGLVGDPDVKSEFVVLADKFMVVTPADSGAAVTVFEAGSVSGVASVGVAGAKIIDGTIYAQSVGANEIITSSANIKDAVIISAKISNLAADKIHAGTIGAHTIYLGNSTFTLDGSNKLLTIKDSQATAVTRVELGKFGVGDTDYGLKLYDSDGNATFQASDTLVQRYMKMDVLRMWRRIKREWIVNNTSDYIGGGLCATDNGVYGLLENVSNHDIYKYMIDYEGHVVTAIGTFVTDGTYELSSPVIAEDSAGSMHCAWVTSNGNDIAWCRADSNMSTIGSSAVKFSDGVYAYTKPKLFIDPDDDDVYFVWLANEDVYIGGLQQDGTEFLGETQYASETGEILDVNFGVTSSYIYVLYNYVYNVNYNCMKIVRAVKNDLSGKTTLTNTHLMATGSRIIDAVYDPDNNCFHVLRLYPKTYTNEVWYYRFSCVDGTTLTSALVFVSDIADTGTFTTGAIEMSDYNNCLYIMKGNASGGDIVIYPLTYSALTNATLEDIMGAITMGGDLLNVEPAATTTNISAASAVGTSIKYAREDHVHRGLMFIKVGTYTGDGVDDREVDIGLNLSAMTYAYVTVKNITNASEAAVHRTNNQTGDQSWVMHAGTFAVYTNFIQSFSTNGFKVGTANTVNDNGDTYQYVVFYQY